MSTVVVVSIAFFVNQRKLFEFFCFGEIPIRAKRGISDRIKQNTVSYASPSLGSMLTASRYTCMSLPGNFIAKIVFAKYRIQQMFQVVAHRRIAVQIDRPNRFQNPLQFQYSDRHVNQIGLVTFGHCRLNKPMNTRMLRLD